MAGLIKHGGWYYAQFFSKHKSPQRKQVALKTQRKRVAEQLKRQLEDAFSLGKFDPWSEQEPDTLTALGAAVDAFVKTRSNLSPHSVRKYTTVLGLLTVYLGPEYPVTAIDAQRLRSFLYSEDREPITRSVYRKTMSTFFSWLIKQRVLQTNPAKAVRLEKVPQKYPQFLTPAEVERLCATIKQEVVDNPKIADDTCLWLIPVIQANVYLGLRVSEVVNLKWDDVDLERRQLVVRIRDDFRTKSGKERMLPLCDEVVEILNSLDWRCEYVFPNYGGTKLHPQYLSRRFKRFVRRAGLPENVKFHTTRHTALSWLAQQGCGVEAIRLYAGHSSIVVTQKYMHLAPDAFHSQINRAFNNVRPAA